VADRWHAWQHARNTALDQNAQKSIFCMIWRTYVPNLVKINANKNHKKTNKSHKDNSSLCF